jgi:uncharacterized membrane protein
MNLLIKLICLHFIFNFFAIANAQQEKIISYDSKIIVNKDGSMLVTEEIKVHAEGKNIKRGIYRDFPTDYKDNYGNNYRITFTIKEILKDGISESYHTERLNNGIRVYIGKASYFLNPGDYTYSIKYKTDRQLGYFDDYDELYWNVTGNGWDFEIDNASSTIILPKGIDQNNIKTLGFTGKLGSKELDFRAEIKSSSEVKFITTHKLNAREGLTIVVQWPKGFVYQPGFKDKLSYFLADNKSAIVLIVGAMLLLLFYIIAWVSVGKDPDKGIIFPLFEPPLNLSPASCRFISKMKFDNKTFTAAIINLCVKGYTILREDNKDYSLVKNLDVSNNLLSTDEQKLLSNLKFRIKNNTALLELKQKNHVTIRGAIKTLKKSLENLYEKQYFFTNKKYFITGIIISVIFILIAGTMGSEELIFTLVWNTMWGVGVSFLIFTVFKTWRSVLAGKAKGAAILSAIFITLFAIPFVGGQIMGLYLLRESGSILLVVGIVIIIIINIVFHHLLKAPTRLGRKVMDGIEGFKMYLSAAEKDRLNSIKAPEKTPELFEKFLPYAIALDVENEWGKMFESVLEKAKAEGNEYAPRWYSGMNWDSLGASKIASSIGSSLTSSISSSSTAPGSSSGSSGGSSGGGGGGGGGGGW